MVKIELGIIANNNVLREATCTEVFNKESLEFILNNGLCEDSSDWNETEQLKKYIMSAKKGKYYFENKVKYSRTRGMNYGRIYPENNKGLCTIRREIRCTISKVKKDDTYKPLYYDVDIANCHFVILSQVCKHNNITCKYVNKYINERESYLADLMKTYEIDRKKAKNLFICVMYGASFDKWIKDNMLLDKYNKKDKINTYINNLVSELNQITEKIIQANEDLCREVKKNKTLKNQDYYNFNASVLSTYLQEYEFRILESLYVKLRHNNLIDKSNNCVLCYDGIMISKWHVDKLIEDSNKELTLKTFLEVLQQHVEDTTGFKIKLEVKELDDDIYDKITEIKEKKINDMLKEDDEKHDEESKDPYDIEKKKFEKNHFKIRNPIMYAEENIEGRLVLRTQEEFKKLYQNNLINTLVYDKKNDCFINKEVNFVDKWFSDPDIRTYERIDCLPKMTSPKYIYNSFKGFEAEKKELKQVKIEESKIYNHLYNLCNKSEDVLKYVLMFLSRKVKAPYKLTNTALMFKSEQGTGKNLFFEWFGNKILGSEYYLSTQEIKHVLGDFNDKIANKILVLLDEVGYKDSIKFLEPLKSAITQTMNIINTKGIKAYDVKNLIGYVLLTNNDVPIKIDVNDRRFLCIKCCDDYANNAEYMKAIIKEMDSGDYDRAFYEYLINLDSDYYDFTNNRPTTQFNEELKEANIPVISRFLEDMIFNKDTYKTNIFKSTRLYNLCDEYIQMNKLNFEMSSTSFGIQLKKYNSIEKKRDTTGNVYVIDFDKLEEELITKKHMKPINK